MQVDDPRLHIIEVDGQQLYVPSPDAWTELWTDPTLDNRKLPVPDLLKRKVQEIAPYPEISGALGFAFNKVQYYELLRIGSVYFRVFIEAVICHHCRHRAVISATPGAAEIYWRRQDEMAAFSPDSLASQCRGVKVRFGRSLDALSRRTQRGRQLPRSPPPSRRVQSAGTGHKPPATECVHVGYRKHRN
jgi:hypothetical protein